MQRALRHGLRHSAAAAAVMVGAWLALGQAQGRDTRFANANRRVDAFKPVTEAELGTPSPGDWLQWRRTSDAWGYSPLTQVTAANVNRLQLVWSWPMQAGADQAGALVRDGVMYLPSPSGLQALDAATGEFIWELKRPGIARRSLALFRDHLYATTAEAHLIAVHAATGAVAWDQTVADSKLGFKYTSGPIIANGLVVAGMTGCEKYKEEVCFISAHDPATGQQRWRTATVARPGEPGGDTWGELPIRLRAGADAWIPGSYDPVSKLIFWGTSQAKPWASAQRGTDAPALYTNSTLALHADTGKLAWYYQHIPGETHDLDEVFERVLVDDGDRQSVFSMGKAGILWELDRKTGRFLNAFDLGYQNVLNVDARSGKVTYRPTTVPKLNTPVEYCPGPGGFKNLFAMAFHPETRAFYIPVKLSCATAVYRGMTTPEWAQGGNGPAERTSLPHPASPNHLAALVAMDSRTGRVLWRHANPLPYDTAVLTTAGGLAFAGDLDRYFTAFDVRSGEVLWRTRTATPPDGFPISYEVRGRQYIAVPTGPGWFVGYWHIRDVLPTFHRVEGSPTMMVFALPAS